MGDELGTKVKKALETGEWWRNDTWVSADYGVPLHSPELRQHAYEVLKNAFSSSWFLKNCRPDFRHPVCSPLLSGGTWTVRLLVDLARSWEGTQDMEGVRQVQRRLLNSKEFYPALFEMQVAAFISGLGPTVRFLEPRRTKSSPDLEASWNGKPFFVEVKTMNRPLVSDLMLSIHTKLWKHPSLSALPAKVSVALKEEILDILRGVRKEEAEVFTSTIVAMIVNGLQRKYQESGAPSKGRIGNYVEYEFLVPEGRGGPVEMSTPDPSPGYDLSRLIRHTLKESLEQLPKSKPGLLAARVELGFDFEFASELLRGLLRRQSSVYENLVGLYLVGRSLEVKDLSVKRRWFFVRNDASLFREFSFDTVEEAYY